MDFLLDALDDIAGEIFSSVAQTLAAYAQVVGRDAEAPNSAQRVLEAIFDEYETDRR